MERAIDLAVGNLPGSEEAIFAADFNGDGVVNVLDVTTMLDALEGKPLASQIKLPPGSAIDVWSLSVLSGLEELTPATDGSLSIPRPEVPLLSMAVSPNGNAMLLAVDSPYGSANELSAQSTAETLVFFSRK